MFWSETANGSLLQKILALMCKPRAFLVIKHEVIKATGRAVAMRRSWYRAKGANGEVAGNINDSLWFVCLSLWARSRVQQTLNSQKIQRQIFLCKDKYWQLQKVRASSVLNLCDHYNIYGQLSQFSQHRLLLTHIRKVGQSKQKWLNLFSHSSVVQTARFCRVLHASKSLSGDELIWSLPCFKQWAETDGIQPQLFCVHPQARIRQAVKRKEELTNLWRE